MPTEALPVREGRPVVVTDDYGWRVYVGPHDAAYLRERSAWKRRIAESHPDRGGDAASFTRLMKSYRQWQEDERRWYARHGLEPPTESARPQQVNRGIGNHWGDTAEAVIASLYEPRTSADIALSLGVHESVIRTAICRLRKLGAPIVTEARSRTHVRYVLTEAWTYERPGPSMAILRALKMRPQTSRELAVLIGKPMTNMHRYVRWLRSQGHLIHCAPSDDTWLWTYVRTSV